MKIPHSLIYLLIISLFLFIVIVGQDGVAEIIPEYEELAKNRMAETAKKEIADSDKEIIKVAAEKLQKRIRHQV